MPPALLGDIGEARRDATAVEKHRGDQQRSCPVIYRPAQSLYQPLERSLRHPDQLDAFLGQTIELTADRVKFAVGGYQARALAEGQRGQEADHQLGRIGSQRDVAITVIQQPTETKADSFGSGEGMLPF